MTEKKLLVPDMPPDTVVEIPEHGTFLNTGEKYVPPAPGTETFESMTVSQLTQFMRDHGLKVAGTKDDLIARAQEYAASPQPEEEEPAEVAHPVEEAVQAALAASPEDPPEQDQPVEAHEGDAQ